MDTELKVTIYTDGGSRPNPGKGGYGVVLLYDGNRKEISDGYRLTTNNRMELMGPIKGLEALNQRCRVDIYSDSNYVIYGIEKGWAKKWKAKGWMKNKKESAINPDLWERLLNLCSQHDVRFHWVKGHSGNPENERCDQLAGYALRNHKNQIDAEYENSLKKST